jgi:hypothetical protein
MESLPDRDSYEPISFPAFDEFAFTLFARWLCGEKLEGPYDFHTLQHYIGLYCLSRIFECEALGNETMDLVRRYYRDQDMTSPPFRLVFVFKNTDGPCAMRNFLVATSAYRLLTQGHLSQVVTDLVESGGELAGCLMEMILRLYAEGVWDPRTRSDCVWHEHKNTPICGERENNSLQDMEDLRRMTVDVNQVRDSLPIS